MKKTFLTLLTLLLLGGVNYAWGEATIYSWQGGSDGATETGGTIAVSNGSKSSDAINESSSTIAGTYYVIKLQSKNNDDTGYSYITLNEALQEDDQIKISGFQNKNATDKLVNIKLLFYQDAAEKGNITEADDANWVNLYNDANYANAEEPETKTFNVTAALAGSNKIRIFRAKSGTNLWINKIQIIRLSSPSISALDASITATESGVEATQNVSITGSNLSGSTLTATLSPAVEGLSVSLLSNTITDGSISTTATLSYTKTSNVRPGTTTLTLSDGTTSKNVTITYYAKVEDWTLQSISESTTWTFNDDNITSGTKSGGATSETVYANIADMTFGSTFDATALAVQGNYPYYTGGSQHIAQAKLLKFNTTVRGRVSVSYAAPSSSEVFISINDGNNGSTESSTTTDEVAVGIGDVSIKGYTDEEHNTESLLNFSEVVFTATPYSVTYDANGADGGSVPAAVAYYEDGETVTVLGNTSSLTKTGATFDGWNTAANGSGTSYAADATFDISENTTLYAQWESVPLGDDVTFNLKNSSFVVSGDGTTQDGINFKSTGTPGSSYLNFSEDKGGQTITIAGSGSKRITKVVLTYTASDNNRTGGGTDLTVSPNDAGYSLSSKTGTWTSANAAGDATVTFTTANKARVEKVVVTYIITASVSLGEYEWATFVSDKALDFTGSDVKAYVITGHEGSVVTMNNDVKKVPANTPLLLNAEEGTYYVPVTADPGTITTNLLHAGDGSAISAVANMTRYVLGVSGSGAAEFQKIVSDPATVPTGKAYLEFDEEINAPSLHFEFDEENNATNVETIEANEKAVKFIKNGQLLILRDGITYDALGRAIR